ncbi:hypothetical protein P7L75_09505 [Tistrella mobilis]|uniref:hypothetical protein n=1 Tax=Tistrella mobilis TaxID=171437 RepID=UPI003556F3CE
MSNINNLKCRARRLGYAIDRCTTPAEARVEGGHLYVLHPVTEPEAVWEQRELVSLAGVEDALVKLEAGASRGKIKRLAVNIGDVRYSHPAMAGREGAAVNCIVRAGSDTVEVRDWRSGKLICFAPRELSVAEKIAAIHAGLAQR